MHCQAIAHATIELLERHGYLYIRKDFDRYDQEEYQVTASQKEKVRDRHCKYMAAKGFGIEEQKGHIYIVPRYTCECFLYKIKYSSPSLERKREALAFLHEIKPLLLQYDLLSFVEVREHDLPWLQLDATTIKGDIPDDYFGPTSSGFDYAEYEARRNRGVEKIPYWQAISNFKRRRTDPGEVGSV